MQDRMQFASAAATQQDVRAALDDLIREIDDQVKGRRPDFATVFISPHFISQAREILKVLFTELETAVLVGCSAEGVISHKDEIEDQAAITVFAASLPGIKLAPFTLQSTDWPRLLLDSQEFMGMVDAHPDPRLFIVFGDPFSTPMADVLQAFNACYPGVPVVGGMASGALRPQGNTLLLNDTLVDQGLVGIALSGPLEVDAVVSQGCRPIWRPFRVEAAHRNRILALDGKPPLALIEELVPELSDEDRALLKGGLFVGQAIHPDQEMLGQGDFLVRGVIRIDHEAGTIEITDSVLEGDIIQFHVRDAITAKEDLEMMLVPQLFRDPPGGGLLFNCNGRGRRLYDHPNGDISVIQANLGSVPLAGFFCAGEIGPVGGKNFLHAHAASLVLLRPLSASAPGV